MATEESYIHQKIKDEMVNASENDTTHIFRTLKNTARVFKNKVSSHFKLHLFHLDRILMQLRRAHRSRLR